MSIKLPGGKSFVVEEFEQDILNDGKMTAREYGRLLREEEEYDQKLGEMALEIADRMGAAERGGRALEYWQVGKLMLDHERGLEVRANQAGLREYETSGRTRKRLMGKVAEIRKDRGAKKDLYSVHYLRKFIRYADLMTEEQAARPVHYSLQHELLYKWLTKVDRDSFLDRCETGEFTTNTELRRAVSELARVRGAKPVTGEDEKDDIEASEA